MMISNDDESAYRDDVEYTYLTAWRDRNNLELNVSKTKEIVVDFRKLKPVHAVLTINKSAIEIVDSFKFLGIYITANLSWSLHIRAICKKAQQ